MASSASNGEERIDKEVGQMGIEDEVVLVMVERSGVDNRKAVYQEETG